MTKQFQSSRIKNREITKKKRKLMGFPYKAT